uniref:Uncharacterized protein n=1 Tax=Parascaris univalens TaxID=6257 RepID=A0A914ZL29_PARUN
MQPSPRLPQDIIVLHRCNCLTLLFSPLQRSRHFIERSLPSVSCSNKSPLSKEKTHPLNFPANYCGSENVCLRNSSDNSGKCVRFGFSEGSSLPLTPRTTRSQIMLIL